MDVKLGIRKLTPAKEAFIFNVPIVAVRTLGWKAYDRLDVIMKDDGSLIIKKDTGDIIERG